MSIKFGNSYLVLFSCCIPVKGARRSVICDLQRNDFLFIPNFFFEIFTQNSLVSYEDLKGQFIEFENFEEEFNKITDLVVQKEYAFWTDEPQLFPQLQEIILSPSKVTNAIIDIDKNIVFDLKAFIDELTSFCCQSVMIRYYNVPVVEELLSVLGTFEHSTIRSIELMLPYTDYLVDSASTERVIGKFSRCKKVVIYGTNSINLKIDLDYLKIFYTEFKFEKDNCCGFVSPHHFTGNIKTFYESKTHNNCLYKKISIDSEGYIKNCPSMRNHYGKYNFSNSLTNAMDSNTFKNLWDVTKDQVKICSDCEFRYICHDCRAFVSNPQDQLSKPAKCTYNPYEAVWE